MAKTFIKSKSVPSNLGPKYRTPDHFRASRFSGGGKLPSEKNLVQKFNPAQFRIQHKGG